MTNVHRHRESEKCKTHRRTGILLFIPTQKHNITTYLLNMSIHIACHSNTPNYIWIFLRSSFRFACVWVYIAIYFNILFFARFVHQQRFVAAVCQYSIYFWKCVLNWKKLRWDIVIHMFLVNFKNTTV